MFNQKYNSKRSDMILMIMIFNIFPTVLSKTLIPLIKGLCFMARIVSYKILVWKLAPGQPRMVYVYFYTLLALNHHALRLSNNKVRLSAQQGHYLALLLEYHLLWQASQ